MTPLASAHPRNRRALSELLLAGIVLFGTVLLSLTCVMPVRAQQATEPPEPAREYTYRVRPGETLVTIAGRYGLDVHLLMRANNIPDPRAIYPGQEILLASDAEVDLRAWRLRRFALGDSLGNLARKRGTAWEMVGRVNRILNPHTIPVGQKLLLPPERTVTEVPVRLGENRATLALRRGLPYWSLVRLNPLPPAPGGTFLLPGGSVTTTVPAQPVVSLGIAPQPVHQGKTAIVALETAAPASCRATYLDREVPCYTHDPTHHYALLGLSPLEEPGRHTVRLDLSLEGGETLSVTLPLHVATGRYDYERIDLPPDRQSLLDPGQVQAELNKLAALRAWRTEERAWDLPFALPTQAAVTSYFGSRRSYGYGFTSFHAGTDFQAERGMPVYAPAGGVVVMAEPLTVRGNAIVIDHGWGVMTGYWHLFRIDVIVGQTVTRGERIGLIGNTGLSTGPHLHWEMWVNGISVDALQWTRSFAESPPLGSQ